LLLARSRDGESLFIGYVTDKTEEEVVAKVGKPETSTPGWFVNQPGWLSGSKSFSL